MIEENYEIVHSLGHIMGMTGKLMRHNLEKAFQDAGYPNISTDKWKILVHLWIQDGKSQQELADEICKDKGSITRSLDDLEKDNLLVRIQDENDRRIKKIYLTHKGKMWKGDLMPIGFGVIEKATSGLDEKEVNYLKSILLKIQDNLKK